LIHGEELALFAQPDAVFASPLSVVRGHETPDFAASAVNYGARRQYGQESTETTIEDPDSPQATEVR
jgi:hypothetical protein